MKKIMLKLGFPILVVVFSVLFITRGYSLIHAVPAQFDNVRAMQADRAVREATRTLGALPEPMPRDAAAGLSDGVTATWQHRASSRTILFCTLDNKGQVSWLIIDRPLERGSSLVKVTPDDASGPEITRHCNAVFGG